MPITITITKVPGRTEQLVLNEDSKVSDALTIAGVSGGEVKINGSVVSPSDILDDGDDIYVFSKIKGALHREGETEAETEEDTITVFVANVPGRMNEITLNGTRTPRAAAAAAGLDVTGRQVRVNENEATLDTVLEDGAVVTFLRKVTGNN